MSDLIDAASGAVTWGDPLTGDEIEALRDHVEPVEIAGDSDWLLAVYVYAVDEPFTAEGVTVDAGTYIRTVHDKHVRAWKVDGLWAARAYAHAVEAAWQEYDA